MCFKNGSRHAWTNNCLEQGQNDTKFELLAITKHVILTDLKKYFHQSYWVRGTIMRWVWITGMSPRNS